MENDDPHAKRRTETNGTAPTVAEPVVKQNVLDEDVNLFEEEKKLNLIDRDDVGGEPDHQLVEEHHSRDSQPPHKGAATAVPTSAQAENAPEDMLSVERKPSSKKKSKRKFTAPRKDPTKPVIMILDSLCQPHSNATRALREWLQAEGLEKRGMTVEIDNKGHYPKSANIPMQNNFSDCGLYVLGYAEKFFRNPDGFKTELLANEMSAEKDWPDMQPSKMREALRKLIYKLYEDQCQARRRASKAARTKAASAPIAKTESKEASPVLQQPSTVAVDFSATAQADEEEELPLANAKMEPDTLSLAPSPSSPLAFVMQPDQLSRQAAEVAGKQHASRSPSVRLSPTSSTTTTPARPEQRSTKRQGNPEVRVPVISPHIDRSSYVRYEDAKEQSPDPAQQTTDLISPLQKHKLQKKDDGKLRMPSARKTQASSPSRPPRKHPMSSSPLQPRPRSGSHDDPITLDDSQDLDAPMQKQPRPTRKPSPDIIELDRSQYFIVAPRRHSPLARQVFRHEDSLQEGHSYEWRESRDVTRALEASLADERLRLNQRPNSPFLEVDDPMEDVSDAQEASPETPHGTQAVGVDEHVVMETPEQQRSSPPLEMDWQATPAHND